MLSNSHDILRVAIFPDMLSYANRPCFVLNHASKNCYAVFWKVRFFSSSNFQNVCSWFYVLCFKKNFPLSIYIYPRAHCCHRHLRSSLLKKDWVLKKKISIPSWVYILIKKSVQLHGHSDQN